MTTYEAVLQYASKSLSQRAAKVASRRKAQAGSILLTLWHLLLVLGGVGAITYGVYQTAEWAGWIVGGLAAFFVRNQLTWEGSDATKGR